MFRYYLDAVRVCKDMLNELSTDPMHKPAMCLALQEKIITLLTGLEKNIRRNKSYEKKIKQALGDRTNRRTKKEARILKLRLKVVQSRIDEYHYFRILFKSFGDGIAFLYIDKYSLKTQNFKESTGFISNKKGNRLERKCLRHALKNETIAILNDLTNVLKYFDITLVKDSNLWIPIEVKSGSSRRQLQQDKADKLLGYLKKDIPTDIYGRGHEITRMEHLTKLIDLNDKANQIIEKGRKEGIIIEKLEEGLTIIAGNNAHAEGIEKRLGEQGFVKPYLFLMNDLFVNQFGYIPFTLSIQSTDTYLDILTNKLQVIQILDFDYFEKLAEKRGYKIEFIGEEINYVRFESLAVPGKAVAVSYHYFGRIFFEFLSPSWFFNEQLDFLDNAEKLYAEFGPKETK